MASSSTATKTTNTVNIPWPCLISQPANTTVSASESRQIQQKTFAQAVSNVCDIPLSQFPKPCVKGDDLAISIPEDEFIAGTEDCKHNLHGRIVLPKGSTPFTVESLRTKLAALWKAIGKWGVISLDMRRVRSIGTWNLSPGILKLFAWTSDFNPSLQQQTSAQVWIRIYGLSQEYWRPKIIFAIASGIGTPICSDSFTSKPMLDRSFGHYVRVLVDLNLFQDLRNRVLVERVGYAFFVDIEYENLPDVCTNCKIIGHHVGNCKRLKDTYKLRSVVAKGSTAPNKVYAPVIDKRKEPEVVDLAGSSTKSYVHVDHAQRRSEEDKELEDELNKDLVSNLDLQGFNVDSPNQVDTQISEDSEFVGDTQPPEVAAIDHVQQIPLVVQKDIEFLKESWANLAELEDNCALDLDPGIASMANKNPVSTGPAASTAKKALNVIDASIARVTQGDVNQQADKVITDDDDSQEFQLVVSKSKRSQKDNQQMSFTVDVSGVLFGITAVYASTYYLSRRALWSKITNIQSQNPLPWCCIGDFNTIIGSHEHRGSSTPARTPMLDFQHWSDSNNLLHLPTQGAFFTWTNGRRSRHSTHKRLDRAICNMDWVNACSSVRVLTLTKIRSDHFPILLEFKNHVTHAPSKFKFMKMWIAHPDCINVIKQSWNINITGCPMFVLTQKLKSLKEKLKVWNRNVFGNIHHNVKAASAKVDSLQQDIDTFGPTDELINQEKTARINFENVLNMEEIFWKEKAKVQWHCEGDRNTAYFHRLAKIRTTTSLITSLNHGYNTLTDPNEIFAHVVDHFSNLFNQSSLQYSAPGPDGFGAIFFQTYWEIIKQDVFKAVLQFFTSGWLLPNFNSNTLVLIPKTNNADSVNHFRPIVVANFKFKIISKILADRLATIMPAITSIQQRGFIKGRSIKDCICVTSEAINVLHKKSFGGNLAIKVDIAKAFDTLEWSFLLKVLKTFGFSQTFCKWIHAILLSAKNSISFNGRNHGFFSCSRRVRQGDPLSPLLFCLAEEVISRSITNLVREGKLTLISGCRNSNVPSHVLYADDIMLFCKGSTSNIQVLASLFMRYGQASGQFVNPQKSSIFAGSISQSKPKKCHLQPLADRVKIKLASWKASLLSIAGRVQLVKSVIYSMLLHSITIYAWPVSLIKDVEKWLRNFIWSGNVEKRKLVTVAWHKVCLPFQEGGLGLRSLSKINEAGNLKLCWELMHSNLQWAQLLKSRVFKKSKPVSYHVSSSIWSGIKHKFPDISLNCSWQIGNGEMVNFWTDSWCGEPLIDSLNIPQNLHHRLQASVSCFINNTSWQIPISITMAYPSIHHYIEQVTLPMLPKDDNYRWIHSHDGNLSFKDAYKYHCHPGQQLPTDENLLLRGCQLPSRCSLCGISEETTHHLFIECAFANHLWNWISTILNKQCIFLSLNDPLKLCSSQYSPLCNLVILSAVVNIFNVIWFCRNQCRFNDKSINIRSAINLVISGAFLSGNSSKLKAKSSIEEFLILKAFSVQISNTPPLVIKEVLWQPPIFNWVKCNSDGASLGNPGPSSCGGLFRNSNAEFLGAFAYN
ncbi:hypothetical protein TSUD_292700 [Trifolium subterraneum]|uniref:Reverse transcriptase domain-containing protein n=1 Tax=Trifolium subterraneum TaxID=3900 RepID=A0A2Z6NW33_TRISU|nr:hypothetical protein TSUD_292700 [Trifolium subterraneum]